LAELPFSVFSALLPLLLLLPFPFPFPFPFVDFRLLVVFRFVVFRFVVFLFFLVVVVDVKDVDDVVFDFGVVDFLFRFVFRFFGDFRFFFLPEAGVEAAAEADVPANCRLLASIDLLTRSAVTVLGMMSSSSSIRTAS
jgi:hypothetical protein